MIDQDEPPYCTKHRTHLDKQTIVMKRCYVGNHGKKYCKYLKLER